jgi:RimJ/RimL family protein N-acetyltransferase
MNGPIIPSAKRREAGNHSPIAIETERLCLRQLTIEDAPFILEVLTDPSFLRFVGDRNVRTVEQAADYILSGPITSYQRFGFGLLLTALKDGNTPIGICGLLQREALEDVDLGFALLPPFRGQGYATECASAALTNGHVTLGLQRMVAIVSPDNAASIRVLDKLGFRFERKVRLTEDSDEIDLLAWHAG